MHNKLAKYSLVSPKKLGHYAENDKMTVENTAEVSFIYRKKHYIVKKEKAHCEKNKNKKKSRF